MPTTTEFDAHVHTRRPICPTCLYVFEDAFEIDFGSEGNGTAPTKCPNCKELCIISREISISYTTVKDVKNVG